MIKRIYTRFEGDRPYTDLDLDRMPGDEQLQFIVTWLLENYQRPVSRILQNTQHDGQWVSDRYLRAREILNERFGEVLPAEIIKKAVEEVETEGLEWEHRTEDDEVEIIRGTLEAKNKSELLRALGDLRDELADLIPPATIGHNNPPEHLIDRPIDIGETVNAIGAVDTLSHETQSDEPNGEIANTALRMLKGFSSKIAAWLGERATVGVDAAIKGAATAAGASAVISWGKVQSLIQKVAELAANLF